VHPLWFYKHQHDNRVRSKLFVACQHVAISVPFAAILVNCAPSGEIHNYCSPHIIKESSKNFLIRQCNYILLSHVYCVWQVVKSPTIILNNLVFEYFAKNKSALHEDMWIYKRIFRWILRRMRSILDESCRKNQNTHFMFNNFITLRKLYCLGDKVKKNMAQPDRSQMTTAHAHCMLDKEGYRHTFTIFNPFCFSTSAMVMRTRVSITLYLACLIWIVTKRSKGVLQNVMWQMHVVNMVFKFLWPRLWS